MVKELVGLEGGAILKPEELELQKFWHPPPHPAGLLGVAQPVAVATLVLIVARHQLVVENVSLEEFCEVQCVESSADGDLELAHHRSGEGLVVARHARHSLSALVRKERPKECQRAKDNSRAGHPLQPIKLTCESRLESYQELVGVLLVRRLHPGRSQG